ncbi:MAG: hypothetical protein WCL04_08825 [Verrucomicrobiota bacterium]
MKLRSLFSVLLVVGWCVPVLPVRAAVVANPPLADLVDDQTALALIVPSAPALVKGWDASPFAKTWNDEQMVKFFAPLRQQMQIDHWDEQSKAATGKTIRELLALAKGGAIIALPSSFIADIMESKIPPILLAVEFGDNAAAFEKLAADAASQNTNLRVETTNYAGILVHTSTPPPSKNGAPVVPDVSAMCQGIWLFSPSYARICAAIDAIKRGGLANGLGRSEAFLRAQKRTGETQLVGYGNFAALYPSLLNALTKALPPAGAAGGPPFTAEGLLKGLGLDVLHEAYYAVNFGAKETTISGGLGWSDERGLVKVLAVGPGAAVRPEWASAKWISVASGKFDLRAAYVALEEVIEAINPQLAAQIQGEIKNTGAQMGIDLKRDLIGSLGSDLVSAVAMPADANPEQPPALDKLDQLFSLSLENPEAFMKAVEAVKHTVFGDAVEQVFIKRDYLGQTLYTYNPPGPAGAPAERGFTYAIANRTAFVAMGSPAIVETALQAMKEKRPVFWERTDVRAALTSAPNGANTVEVEDMRVVVTSLLGMLGSLPLPAQVQLVDAAAKPDFAHIARYWGLSSGYGVKEAKGFFSVNRIANPLP